MIFVAMLALFAVAQNIDNFVVAVAYGLKNIRICVKSNFLIGFLSATATGTALLVGSILRLEAVLLGFKSIPEVIGRGVLFMLGVWTLVGFFRVKLFRQLGGVKLNQSETAVSSSAVMAAPEAVVVGLALAVDNVAPSFAVGLIDSIKENVFVSLLFLTLLTGGLSVFAVSQGQALGRKGYVRFRRLALAVLRPELISGILFIGVAILPLDPEDLVGSLLHVQVETNSSEH